MTFGYEVMRYQHIPVLVSEVLQNLKLHPDGVYVDATIGEGGHSEKILEKISPTGKLIGIDLDTDALKIARTRLRKYKQCFWPVKGNFRNLPMFLENKGVKQVDGILFDLGTSSFHLADCQRGFSFKFDGPLDMRIDTGQEGKASDLLNNLKESELVEIIFKYGQERWARRIAKKIVQRRPIITTHELVTIIKESLPVSARHGRLHLATRTFQALRIAVNKELENLTIGLSSAFAALKKTGRIVVISYHSLEDRIVKRAFLNEREIKIITKKPLRPKREEVSINPCSRSAKLRVGEKV